MNGNETAGAEDRTQFVEAFVEMLNRWSDLDELSHEPDETE